MLKKKAAIWVMVWGLLTLFGSFGYGQNNRSNPFEVSSRIQNLPAVSSEQETMQKDSADVGIAGNPFEVNHVPLRRQQFKPVQKAIEDISKVKPKVSTSFISLLDHDFFLGHAGGGDKPQNQSLGYLLRSMFNLNMMKLTKRDEAGVIIFISHSSICVFSSICLCLFICCKSTTAVRKASKSGCFVLLLYVEFI